MLIPFVFVTHSEGKLTEVERIVGQRLKHSDIDLSEIQAVEVEDVVTSKAIEAFNKLRKPVMIEDTGLYIESWNGLPGALIKWFVEYAQEPGICKMLNEFPNRRAWAKTIVATYDGNSRPKTFPGKVEGSIAYHPTGNKGFGWDKIFIPNGSEKTFGEMSGEEKDKYSMRRLAFEAVTNYYLNNQTE